MDAIQTGDVETLPQLLADHPGLATARLGDDDPDGMSPDAEAHAVVVDGRYLTWEEFGAALTSFEGWRFRCRIPRPGR